jgi:hypothetical protein
MSERDDPIDVNETIDEVIDVALAGNLPQAIG